MLFINIDLIMSSRTLKAYLDQMYEIYNGILLAIKVDIFIFMMQNYTEHVTSEL